MPKIRHLGTAAAMVAGSVVALSSVAAAHPGHGFDHVFIGTNGPDSFTADPGDRDLIFGRAGDDKLDAGDKHDHVFGGRGNDTIYGGAGSDLILGGPGDDGVRAGDGRDRVFAGRGDDKIAGGEGNDKIAGGPGNDKIAGEAGRDLLLGGPGNDFIYAADGEADRVNCGPGRDRYTADDIDSVADNCEIQIATDVAP